MKHASFALIACVLLIPMSYAVAAPAKVSVHLNDRGSKMSLKASPTRVKAGPVEIDVSNDSKDMVHETIVVKVRRANQKLPYDKKKNRLIESRMDKVGDSDDLKPGAKKVMRLRLKAGTYILICNEPGHYAAGMHQVLHVAK